MVVRVIRLPDIGEGVADAEVVEWMVSVGDLVAEDQLLAAVMTDKATVEIPSPVAGRVMMIGAEIGERLAVGGDLISIDTSASASANGAAAGSGAAEVAAGVPRATPDCAPAGAADGAPATQPAPPQESPAVSQRILAAPAVRERARMMGIDLGQISGTGPEGHITHEDLDRFLGHGGGASAGGQTFAPVPIDRVDEIKVVGLRRQIAEAMAETTRRISSFTYVEEIDVSELETLRTTLNAGAGERVKLTLLPFITRAVVRAIADFPQMNAHYDDEANVIRRYGGVHMGIATQTPGGLVVPVVRHAEARDIWDCAAEIRRLAEAARNGSATRDELTGSTITVTSLGALGGIAATPIINRPEVAIIGVNRVTVRPVWQHNQFVPRKMMNLSSSFAHRVIDGYDAAAFIQKVKGLLEQPALMFT